MEDLQYKIIILCLSTITNMMPVKGKEFQKAAVEAQQALNALRKFF
jgi:hypothetical protein